MDRESLKLLENYIGYILLKEKVRITPMDNFHGDIHRCVIDTENPSQAVLYSTIFKEKFRENVSSKDILHYSERLFISFNAVSVNDKIVKDSLAGFYWSFYDIEKGRYVTFASEKKYQIRMKRISLFPYVITTAAVYENKSLDNEYFCITLISSKIDSLKSKMVLLSI